MTQQFRYGIVESDVDGSGLGRVKVRTNEGPNVSTAQLPEMWVAGFLGGGNNYDGAGSAFTPHIGQKVLVGYEAGSDTNPIIIGLVPSEEGGLQSLPLELRIPGQSASAIQGFRLRSGAGLMFDSRDLDDSNSLAQSLSLKTGMGYGLTIQDGKELNLAFKNACLTLADKEDSKGLCLLSPEGAGLAVNDIDDLVVLTTKGNQPSVTLAMQGNPGQFLINAEAGFKICSRNENACIQSPDGDFMLSLKSKGAVKLDGAKVRIQSTSDLNLAAVGGKITTNAKHYELASTGGNFTLNFVSPGNGIESGNIQMNTAAGNVLIRHGLSSAFVPRPTSEGISTGFGADLLTGISNDPHEGIGKNGRLVIGKSGTAILEGKIGGMYISSTPIPLLSGQGLGRIPTPLAPIVPTLPLPVPPTPIGSVNPVAASGPTPDTGMPQPAVMGTNLHHLLTVLVSDILAFLQVMTSTAPAFAMSPMGPATLNPLVITQLANFQTDLGLILGRLNVPNNPQGILSSIVFLDG